jgi:hypothetical protein
VPNGFEPALDTRCPFCGTSGLEVGAVCRTCESRWEEMECRELRYRLFGFFSEPDPRLLPPD